MRGLLVADINLEAATKTAVECSKVVKNVEFKAEAVQMDVTRADSVENAMETMITTFGRVDYCKWRGRKPFSHRGFAD